MTDPIVAIGSTGLPITASQAAILEGMGKTVNYVSTSVSDPYNSSPNVSGNAPGISYPTGYSPPGISYPDPAVRISNPDTTLTVPAPDLSKPGFMSTLIGQQTSQADSSAGMMDNLISQQVYEKQYQPTGSGYMDQLLDYQTTGTSPTYNTNIVPGVVDSASQALSDPLGIKSSISNFKTPLLILAGIYLLRDKL